MFKFMCLVDIMCPIFRRKETVSRLFIQYLIVQVRRETSKDDKVIYCSVTLTPMKGFVVFSNLRVRCDVFL